jgi:hypothetical protein
MNISPNDLKAAVAAKLITQKQADSLSQFWQKNHADVPSFRLTHVLYYFGGILAISAITLFVTQAWELLLGWPLFMMSALFFIFGLLLMRYFLNLQLRIPAGIMATFSLVAVPLAIYNFQYWLGFYPHDHMIYSDYNAYVSWVWVPMELGTLLVGIIMFYFFRFPFLLFPISVTLWYLSMDLYQLLYLTHYDYWQGRSVFSTWFGLIMLVYSFYVDIKHNDEKNDYAFWLYLFGVMTFWGGLSSQSSNSQLSHFIYCMINVVMIFVGVFLNRKVFTIFGAIGVLGYLGYLSFSIFKGSLAFPVVLVFLGVLIILLATRWASVENRLFNWLRPYIPAAILSRRKLD